MVRVRPSKGWSNLPVVGFFPFQYVYHWGCILLVNSLRFWRWCSAPSPLYIHISADRLLTVWADLPDVVWVVRLRMCFESSCGRIFPVPRYVSSRMYSLGQFITLLASVLRSYASIHTYICGQIFDCLSRPYIHSLSGTFGEAFWIFLWLYFSRSKTCIINCVLSWSIIYVVGVGANILLLYP